MKNTLEELKREAENAAIFRGHTLPMKGWEDYEDGKGAEIACQRCGKEVQVLTTPQPNEIDIGGEMIATDCQPPLTLEQAKGLKPGDMLYHRINNNADGTPQRWKVNGKPKTWKRSPERVRVPIKHGMYHYDYLTELYLDLVSLEGTR